MYVCVPVLFSRAEIPASLFIGVIQRQVKQMKAFGDLTPFYRVEEMVKSPKKLNFL